MIGSSCNEWPWVIWSHWWAVCSFNRSCKYGCVDPPV